MTFSDIAKIEDQNTEYVYLYKEGIFWKAYERSAYILCTQVRNYRVMQRYSKKVNGGLKLLLIGFPISNEQEHISSLEVVEKGENSIKLKAPSPIKPSDFDKWKENIWEEEVSSSPIVPVQIPEVPVVSGGKAISVIQDIANEIRKFDIATATPVECMVFLSSIKKKLIDVDKI